MKQDASRSPAGTGPAPIAICVNPMSGRDVRRLAAHAANMTHEAKRDIVARVAAGADAMGATDIFIAREPFRIATAALQHMLLTARVHVLDFKIRNGPADTETAIRGYLDEGCDTIVSLGGDGTNRAIVRTLGSESPVRLIPLSTGTNNVFPSQVEPTIAGMVAGLLASRRLEGGAASRRAKVLHVSGTGTRDAALVDDVGLIDAVLLEPDHVGNLLPIEADRIKQLLLSRAEPTAVGMSPIGGMLEVVDAEADEGLLVYVGPGTEVIGSEAEVGGSGTGIVGSGTGIVGSAPEIAGSETTEISVPLSPGLFRTVSVRSVQRIGFDVAVPFRGPGVLALDGDRDYRIRTDGTLTVTLRRDGPWLPDVEVAMRQAVAQGIIARPTRR